LILLRPSRNNRLSPGKPSEFAGEKILLRIGIDPPNLPAPLMTPASYDLPAWRQYPTEMLKDRTGVIAEKAHFRQGTTVHPK
jgi:hypothetical protein